MPNPERSGYSGKALHAKLGLKPGAKAYGVSLPEGYFDWLELDQAEALFQKKPSKGLDFIHAFVDSKAHIAPVLGKVSGFLADEGQLWASWRKGKLSDVSDQDIRAWALAQDLVDVKVCAVSAEWSGLKLVRRRELRGKKA